MKKCAKHPHMKLLGDFERLIHVGLTMRGLKCSDVFKTSSFSFSTSRRSQTDTRAKKSGYNCTAVMSKQ